MFLDRKDRLQILSIILVVIFGVAQLYLNWPSPKLEVGVYETSGIKWIWEFEFPENFTIPFQFNMSGAISYTEVNMTFIIYNSGKGPANGITVKLSGEQKNVCEIISGYIFAGQPVQANFLTNIKSSNTEYRWGLLGASELFSIIYYIKVYRDINEDHELNLEVTSENTGTIIQSIIIKERKDS